MSVDDESELLTYFEEGDERDVRNRQIGTSRKQLLGFGEEVFENVTELASWNEIKYVFANSVVLVNSIRCLRECEVPALLSRRQWKCHFAAVAQSNEKRCIITFLVSYT